MCFTRISLEYLRKLKYLNKVNFIIQNGGRNLYIVVITKQNKSIILSYHSNKVRNSIMLTYKNYKIICTILRNWKKRYIARSGSPLSIDEFYQVYNKNIED